MIEYVDKLPAHMRSGQMRPKARVTKDLVEFMKSGKKCARVGLETSLRLAYVASYSYAKRHSLPVSVLMRNGELYFTRNDE